MGMIAIWVLILLFACWSFVEEKSPRVGWMNLAAVPVSWVGLAIYEAAVGCPLTKCNIRPDLLLVVPLLFVNTIVCIAAAVRHLGEASSTAEQPHGEPGPRRVRRINRHR